MPPQQRKSAVPQQFPNPVDFARSSAMTNVAAMREALHDRASRHLSKLKEYMDALRELGAQDAARRPRSPWDSQRAAAPAPSRSPYCCPCVLCTCTCHGGPDASGRTATRSGKHGPLSRREHEEILDLGGDSPLRLTDDHRTNTLKLLRRWMRRQGEKIRSTDTSMSSGMGTPHRGVGPQSVRGGPTEFSVPSSAVSGSSGARDKRPTRTPKPTVQRPLADNSARPPPAAGLNSSRMPPNRFEGSPSPFNNYEEYLDVGGDYSSLSSETTPDMDSPRQPPSATKGTHSHGGSKPTNSKGCGDKRSSDRCRGKPALSAYDGPSDDDDLSPTPRDDSPSKALSETTSFVSEDEEWEEGEEEEVGNPPAKRPTPQPSNPRGQGEVLMTMGSPVSSLRPHDFESSEVLDRLAALESALYGGPRPASRGPAGVTREERSSQTAEEAKQQMQRDVRIRESERQRAVDATQKSNYRAVHQREERNDDVSVSSVASNGRRGGSSKVGRVEGPSNGVDRRPNLPDEADIRKTESDAVGLDACEQPATPRGDDKKTAFRAPHDTSTSVSHRRVHANAARYWDAIPPRGPEGGSHVGQAGGPITQLVMPFSHPPPPSINHSTASSRTAATLLPNPYAHTATPHQWATRGQRRLSVPSNAAPSSTNTSFSVVYDTRVIDGSRAHHQTSQLQTPNLTPIVKGGSRAGTRKHIQGAESDFSMNTSSSGMWGVAATTTSAQLYSTGASSPPHRRFRPVTAVAASDEDDASVVSAGGTTPRSPPQQGPDHRAIESDSSIHPETAAPLTAREELNVRETDFVVLGLTLSNRREQLGLPGIHVHRVAPQSPAALIGLRPNDVIVEWNPRMVGAGETEDVYQVHRLSHIEELVTLQPPELSELEIVFLNHLRSHPSMPEPSSHNSSASISYAVGGPVSAGSQERSSAPKSPVCTAQRGIITIEGSLYPAARNRRRQQYYLPGTSQPRHECPPEEFPFHPQGLNTRSQSAATH